MYIHIHYVVEIFSKAIKYQVSTNIFLASHFIVVNVTCVRPVTIYRRRIFHLQQIRPWLDTYHQTFPLLTALSNLLMSRDGTDSVPKLWVL
jgi:hypothetical protein